jgi:hypothetical protein
MLDDAKIDLQDFRTRSPRFQDTAMQSTTLLLVDTYEGQITDPITLHKYLYAGANPVNNTDASGNDFISDFIVSSGMFTMVGQISTTRPATSGPTINQPIGIAPKVYKVFCYIKGDPIWGTAPCHEYLLIDGIGYGKYANSHIGGPPDASGGVGVIATMGKVISGDESKYPVINPASLPSGTPYGVASPVDESVDTNKLKKLVLNDLDKPTEYGAGTDDCFRYCDKVIQDSSTMGWLDRFLKLPG